METNVKYTLVGIFVIVLLLFAILMIAWLTTGLTGEEYANYKVYMHESVSGISLDEPVEFNGVPVGKIKKITLNPKNPQLVEIDINIKKTTPVTQGTYATLSVRGLTGIAYIALEDRGTNIKPLTGTPSEPYPVIPTKPSILVRLDTALTQINDSFTQLNQSVKALLSQQNLQSIKRILSSGQNTFHTLHTQTLPSANQAITDINRLTRNLNDISNEIKQNPAVLIRGKSDVQQGLGPGEQ